MEPFSQYAVAAALEAYEDSGLDMSKEDPFRAGVIVGSGIGSLQEVEREYEKILYKRTFQGESSDGAADDLQHGGGKYLHPAGIQRENAPTW